MAIASPNLPERSQPELSLGAEIVSQGIKNKNVFAAPDAAAVCAQGHIGLLSFMRGVSFGRAGFA
jgi:hypothetical protein